MVWGLHHRQMNIDALRPWKLTRLPVLMQWIAGVRVKTGLVNTFRAIVLPLCRKIPPRARGIVLPVRQLRCACLSCDMRTSRIHLLKRDSGPDALGPSGGAQHGRLRHAALGTGRSGNVSSVPLRRLEVAKQQLQCRAVGLLEEALDERIFRIASTRHHYNLSETFSSQSLLPAESSRPGPLKSTILLQTSKGQDWSRWRENPPIQLEYVAPQQPAAYQNPMTITAFVDARSLMSSAAAAVANDSPRNASQYNRDLEKAARAIVAKDGGLVRSLATGAAVSQMVSRSKGLHMPTPRSRDAAASKIRRERILRQQEERNALVATLTRPDSPRPVVLTQERLSPAGAAAAVAAAAPAGTSPRSSKHRRPLLSIDLSKLRQAEGHRGRPVAGPSSSRGEALALDRCAVDDVHASLSSRRLAPVRSDSLLSCRGPMSAGAISASHQHQPQQQDPDRLELPLERYFPQQPSMGPS